MEAECGEVLGGRPKLGNADSVALPWKLEGTCRWWLVRWLGACCDI